MISMKTPGKGGGSSVGAMHSDDGDHDHDHDHHDSTGGGGGGGGRTKRAVAIDLRRVPGVDILADQALIGYCKIIAEINRNKYVMRYRQHPKLTEDGHEFKVR